MGYTNYWTRPRTIPKATFRKISNDARALAEALPPEVVVFGPEGVGRPVFNDDEVFFNGDFARGLAHEDFFLPRKRPSNPWAPDEDPVLDFCKTVRKPYDLFVKAVLLRVRVHCPSWRISSDGDPGAWRDAAAFCDRVLGPGHAEAAATIIKTFE